MPRPELPASHRAFGQAVAAHLKQKREVSGLTTSQVSARTGLSVDTIRALEAGRVPTPGFLTVLLVCRAIEVGLDELAASTWHPAGSTPKRGSGPRRGRRPIDGAS